MFKKSLLLLIVLALLALLSAAIAVRQLPDLVSKNLRLSLGREVSIGSVRFEYPFTVVMNQLRIAENDPFDGETAFYVERAAASVDPWVLWSEHRFRFTKTSLLRPKIIFRKSLSKVHHAFRKQLGPATAMADQASDKSADGDAAHIPPMQFDLIHIEDGEIQWIDYDVDRKGFVTSLLRITSDIRGAAIPSSGDGVAFELEAYLDQGRDITPGRLQIDGSWRKESLEGNVRASLSGVQLTSFAPYYRMVTPSRIADGELDIVASAESPGGILTAHSKWTLRRLSFEQTESGNTLMGFDANLIQGILAGDDGILKLDLAADMDLRNRSTPLREVLLQSIRKSIKATFLSNFDSAVQSTVDKLADQGTELLKKQNWKDLLKKNKLQTVVNDVMNPS